MRLTVFFLCVLTALPASAQVVDFWTGGFSEQWTTPGTAVPHNGPVTLCPDGNAVDAPPCPCPRTTGFSMGAFHLNGAVFSTFQAATHTASNPGTGYETYQTDPASVGDHLDAFFRYDDTGNAAYDGSYDRLPDYFSLPPNGQLHTLADDSVKQDPGDTLPVPYQQHVSQGTAWQVGAGFTTFVGPKLNTDAAGAQRVYAFFAPESYPADQAQAGHLVGFASVPVPSNSRSIPKLWTGVWKDAASQNDAEYKLAHNVPLRTLYLQEFTPIIAFRGDAGIRRDMTNPRGIGLPRLVIGMTGWYRDGYFYLLTTTLVSTNIASDWCYTPARETRPTYGQVLFRIRADLTGTSGYGGLWLDANKRPQVELFRSTQYDGPKSFIALPNPESVVSFSDDDRQKGSGPPQCADIDNRQLFTGCCTNPAVPAAYARIPYPGRPVGEQLGASSTFTFEDNCSRYVVLNPVAEENPAPNAPAWQSNHTYARGDVITVSGRGFVCTQAGQSGATPPTWPSLPWYTDLGADVTDNTVTWRFAVGSLLLRLRDNASTCGTGDPAYTVEDAGMLLHPYPNGYGRDEFYGPWANVVPLPGAAGTLLGYRPVRNVADNTEGQMSFTVMPDLLNCRITTTPAATNAQASGEIGTITITAPESRCAWIATSNSAFLTLATSRGNGSGTLQYTLAANTGSQRTATITIAGQTTTITQAAAALPTPTGLVAQSTTQTSVTVTWQPSSGATAYRLERAATNGIFTLLSAAATSPYTDNSATSNHAYLYRVQATNGGQSSAYSPLDYATTYTYTDDPLVAQATTLKAAHITELRATIDALRVISGLAPGSYTDATLTGLAAKAVHITELRTQLNQARTALGLGLVSFTDTITTGTPIKAVHVQELRDATR